MPARVDPQRAVQAVIAVHSLALLLWSFPFPFLWHFVWPGVDVTFGEETAVSWVTGPIVLGATLLLPIVAVSIELVDCWSVACRERNLDLHMSSIAVHIGHNVDAALSRGACMASISMVRGPLKPFVQRSEPET